MGEVPKVVVVERRSNGCLWAVGMLLLLVAVCAGSQVALGWFIESTGSRVREQLEQDQAR